MQPTNTNINYLIRSINTGNDALVQNTLTLDLLLTITKLIDAHIILATSATSNNAYTAQAILLTATGLANQRVATAKTLVTTIHDMLINLADAISFAATMLGNLSAQYTYKTMVATATQQLTPSATQRKLAGLHSVSFTRPYPITPFQQFIKNIVASAETRQAISRILNYTRELSDYEISILGRLPPNAFVKKSYA